MSADDLKADVECGMMSADRTTFSESNNVGGGKFKFNYSISCLSFYLSMEIFGCSIDASMEKIEFYVVKF